MSSFNEWWAIFKDTVVSFGYSNPEDLLAALWEDDFHEGIDPKDAAEEWINTNKT
jgi:hypothetical protein